MLRLMRSVQEEKEHAAGAATATRQRFKQKQYTPIPQQRVCFIQGLLAEKWGTAVELRQKAILKREAEKEEATTA
jgi:hypothetical protein